MALLTGVGIPALAQFPVPPVIFLEKAYFALGTPSDKNLRFEGQPAAHFFIVNRFSELDWQKKGGFTYAVPISELFVVRMTNSASDPVLTPSYHIGPRFQGIQLWRPKSDSGRAYWMLHVLTGAIHYSNGQHGCTYLGFTRNPATGACEVTDLALSARREANTLDGDFSTTYFPLALHLRRAHLINPGDWMKWQWTVGAEFQAHPYGKIPGSPNREQAVEYGQHQWSAFAEWECRVNRPPPPKHPNRSSGVIRLAGDFTNRFGAGARPFRRGGVEASYVVDTLRVWKLAFQRVGLFARRSSGYDYYNIHFQDRRSFWSAGIMFDPGRLDQLEIPIVNDGQAARDEAASGCVKFWKRAPRPRPR